MSGVLRDEAFDVGPVLREAARFFYGHPVYMDLPRKQKFSISACPDQCDMPEINCMSFIGVVRDGRDGFALRVGGGLSTVPRLARDLGVWIPVGDAMAVMQALLDIWREDRRYRLSRVKARFKFMVDDHGVEAIRSMVEARLGRPLDDGAAPDPRGFTAHVGVGEQKQDGLFHLGAPIPVGITDGDQLIRIASLARSVGGDVRLTKQQNLIVTGVPEARLDEAKAELADIGFPVDANQLRATGIAVHRRATLQLRGHGDEVAHARVAGAPGGAVGCATRFVPREPGRLPARLRAALGRRHRSDGNHRARSRRRRRASGVRPVPAWRRGPGTGDRAAAWFAACRSRGSSRPSTV